jgi:hypothetical protein
MMDEEEKCGPFEVDSDLDSLESKLKAQKKRKILPLIMGFFLLVLFFAIFGLSDLLP